MRAFSRNVAHACSRSTSTPMRLRRSPACPASRRASPISKAPFANAAFDAIVVANYLHRAALPHLLESLTPHGALLYETFAAGNEAYGRPSNPAFLLHESELLECVRDRLSIVAFEQGRIGHERVAVVQRIAAVGRARAWPPSLPAPG